MVTHTPHRTSQRQISRGRRNRTIIDAQNVHMSFQVGKETVEVLHGISLTINRGDFVMIYGPSGSGKSTLLNVLLGLEKPTSGTVTVMNKSLFRLEDDERARFRARNFGIVYQQPIWVRSLNVLDNVALPLLLKGESLAQARREAMRSLEEFKLSSIAHNLPAETSGGQQQRAEIARAIVSDSPIIVADEPTGNLDTHSADQVMSLMQRLQTAYNRTVIMVTHNLIYLPMATKQIVISDGQVVDGEKSAVEVVKRQLHKHGAK